MACTSCIMRFCILWAKTSIMIVRVMKITTTMIITEMTAAWKRQRSLQTLLHTKWIATANLNCIYKNYLTIIPIVILSCCLWKNCWLTRNTASENKKNMAQQQAPVNKFQLSCTLKDHMDQVYCITFLHVILQGEIYFIFSSCGWHHYGISWSHHQNLAACKCQNWRWLCSIRSV